MGRYKILRALEKPGAILVLYEVFEDTLAYLPIEQRVVIQDMLDKSKRIEQIGPMLSQELVMKLCLGQREYLEKEGWDGSSLQQVPPARIF